jgi:protease stability complex PrcB-like protein
MPRIDFERDMVIAAAMGSMTSTGFGIAIDSVIDREPSLEVHVVLVSPGSLCLQGMAMTNPVDIVQVPKSFRVVEFRDRHVRVECKMR